MFCSILKKLVYSKSDCFAGLHSSLWARSCKPIQEAQARVGSRNRCSLGTRAEEHTSTALYVYLTFTSLQLLCVICACSKYVYYPRWMLPAFLQRARLEIVGTTQSLCMCTIISLIMRVSLDALSSFKRFVKTDFLLSCFFQADQVARVAIVTKTQFVETDFLLSCFSQAEQVARLSRLTKY